MKTYLAHLKAKGVKAVPAEFSLNVALALYSQIDELKAENKFLADTAAKLAKELTQADKLAKALEVLERNTKHRQGDCYSDDYMGVCVCGKDIARAAIARATNV